MQYTMSAALSGFLNPQYLWYDPGNSIAEASCRLIVRAVLVWYGWLSEASQNLIVEHCCTLWTMNDMD